MGALLNPRDTSRINIFNSTSGYIQTWLYCFTKAFGITGLEYFFAFQTLLEDAAIQKAIDSLKQILYLMEHQPADVAVVFEGELFIKEIHQAIQRSDEELGHLGNEDGDGIHDLIRCVRHHLAVLEDARQAGELILHWTPSFDEYPFNVEREFIPTYSKSLLVNIEILTEEGKALTDPPFPRPPQDLLFVSEAADWYRQTLERLPSLIPATATPSQAQAIMQQLKRQAFALALNTQPCPGCHFVARFPEDWKEITGEEY